MRRLYSIWRGQVWLSPSRREMALWLAEELLVASSQMNRETW